MTREGIELKLIVTRMDAPLYDRPDKSSPHSSTPLWTFFFVLPPDPQSPTRLMEELEELHGGWQTENSFYRVARPRKRAGRQQQGEPTMEEAGWLYAGDVVEWHHRQALKPTFRNRRRSPAYFWEDREQAVAAAARQQGRRPKNPVAKEPDEAEVTLLLPLLKRYPVNIGGDPQDLYRVAFIGAPAGRDRSGARPAPGSLDGRPTRAQALAAATADIVFVIDTTLSMKNAITQVRQSVAEASRSITGIPELRGRLRFGLVGYRDTTQGNPLMEYTARVFCTLEEGRDHARFLEILNGLDVTKTGSKGWPEEGLAGLALAIDRQRMGWNPFSHSLVVLVGDASAKSPQHPTAAARTNEPWNLLVGGKPVPQGSRTVEALLAVAQPGEEAVRTEGRAQIGFLAILVNNGDKNDYKYAQRQYGVIATGRNLAARGYFHEVGGGVKPADFSQWLAESLKDQFGSMGEVIRTRGEVTLEPGASVATAAVGFLQLLRVLPGSGPKGEYQFARGYCTQFNSEGERQFDPYYLVHRADVNKFLGGLEAFLALLRGGSRDVGFFVDGLQMISTGLAYEQEITSATRLKDILESQLGLPIRNKIFNYTPAMLRGLSQGEFDEWVREVGSVRGSLRDLVDTPSKWTALDEGSGYGFIKVSELP